MRWNEHHSLSLFCFASHNIHLNTSIVVCLPFERNEPINNCVGSFFWCLLIRYLSRFFDCWAHETMYAYIGNKHFFTKSYDHQNYQNSKISWQKMCSILLIKGFKNRSYQKMPIKTNVPLNWYSSMKKKI